MLSSCSVGPMAAVVLPLAAPPPLLPQGLVSFSKAPTGRSTCLICMDYVAKNAFRLQYRTRAGTSMSNLRYLHWTCARLLPVETRLEDISKAQRWLGDAQLSENDADASILERVVMALQGGGAAGSSGG